MSEWKLNAACRAHHSPEWWFPDKVDDNAIDAKSVCVVCPVRRECGEQALAQGEKWAVMGGYRCSVESDRAALRRWLGKTALLTRVCTGCNTEFETWQRHKRCPSCRGLVSIEPAQAHLRELHDIGLTYVAISAMSGVPIGTVLKLANGHPQYEWRHCQRQIADKILAVQIPGEEAA